MGSPAAAAADEVVAATSCDPNAESSVAVSTPAAVSVGLPATEVAAVVPTMAVAVAVVVVVVADEDAGDEGRALDRMVVVVVDGIVLVMFYDASV